jgi:transposase
LDSDIKGEHRLRVFEKGVLRRIFGQKRDELIEGWRKLHKEELRNLFSSPSVTKMLK